MKTSLNCVLLLMLTACGETFGGGTVRQTLGLNRSAPDEFKVVSRPPLSVPPEFRLNKPAPGAPPRGVASAEQQASSLVLGRRAGNGQAIGHEALDLFTPEAETTVMPIVSEPLHSTGDTSFLSKAGADNADSNIREKLYQGEDEPVKPANPQFGIESLFGADANAQVVDPKAESVRIRENLDEDKPVNEGEVETVDPTPSTLDMIF